MFCTNLKRIVYIHIKVYQGFIWEDFLDSDYQPFKKYTAFIIAHTCKIFTNKCSPTPHVM